MRSQLGAGAALAVAVLAAAVGLSACTSGVHAEVSKGSPVAAATGTSSGATSAPATSSTAATPAVIHVQHATRNLNPAKPLGVSVSGGKLTAAKLVNDAGTVVTSKISDDGTTWATTEALGYSKTYHLTATAVGDDGQSVTKTATFTTLSPVNQTMPYLDTLMGQPLVNHATYGVGIIPVVVFDEPITDKAAAERALSVTQTNPDGTKTPITGTWYWLDDSRVHWRAPNYLHPGTKVTVSANVYGVNMGNGLYGQTDQTVSFTIGDKRVAIADDATHMVTVYFSGKKMHVMPTAMGRGGFVEGKNGPIPLWTMPGTYTVIGHENPAIMSSDSYGLPANSPAGYAPEKVYWSTKISTDGIYLHELDTTVWAQGNTDVSHGCLNLNHDNAQWYFTHSRVGDIVQVIHVHTVDGQASAKVALWQGGDWTQSYADLQKLSALH